MGVRYVGGGFLTNIPRRDMTGAELDTFSDELRGIIARSPFYTQIPDEEVGVQRAEYTRPVTSWPRVLMVTPTYRFEPETAMRAREIVLGYPGVIDWLVTRDNPDPLTVRRGYRNILLNMEKARRLAIDGGYDAMFVLESDILPPADALRRLVEIDADVAGGLYALRGDANVMNVFCYVPREASPGASLERREIADAWGRQTRVNGVCLGCTLVWRRVFESTPFRLSDLDSAAPDWWLMVDCNTRELVTVADLRVICGHINPDGSMLMPLPDGGAWRYPAANAAEQVNRWHT